MRAKIQTVLAISVVAFVCSACWSEAEVTEQSNACATRLYSRYDPKILKQCVDVCIQCNRGTTTTCSTSCTLKGAT